MDYDRYWAMVFGVRAQLLDGGGEAWLTEAEEHHYRALDALLTAIAGLRSEP